MQSFSSFRSQNYTRKIPFVLSEQESLEWIAPGLCEFAALPGDCSWESDSDNFRRVLSTGVEFDELQFAQEWLYLTQSLMQVSTASILLLFRSNMVA